MGTTGAVVASGLTTGRHNWRISYQHVLMEINLLYKYSDRDNCHCSSPEMPFTYKREIRAEKQSFDTNRTFSCYINRIISGCSNTWTCMGFCILWANLGLFTVSLISFISFIITEKKVSYPLVSLDFFRIRLFTLPLASGMTLFVSLFSMIFLMPFYWPVKAFPPQTAGLMMITPFMFLFILSPISGSLSDRIGSRLLCTSGMAVVLCFPFSSVHAWTWCRKETAIAWRMAMAGIE